MNFFKLLAAILTSEVTMTIVIKKNESGRLSVSTSFTTEKGSFCDNLVPFLLKGTPEEMDEGFLEAVSEPVKQVEGLVSNHKDFEASVQKAKNIMSKPAPSSASAAASEKAKKEAEERRLKEERRKQDYKKLTEDAAEAEKKFKYCTVEALLTLAKQYTDDKKELAAIDKKISFASYNKSGLMSTDTEEDAKAAVEAFGKMQENREGKTDVPETAPAANTAPEEPEDDADATGTETDVIEDESEIEAEAA